MENRDLIIILCEFKRDRNNLYKLVEEKELSYYEFQEIKSKYDIRSIPQNKRTSSGIYYGKCVYFNDYLNSKDFVNKYLSTYGIQEIYGFKHKRYIILNKSQNLYPNIRKLRFAKGYNQKKVAEEIGISQSAYCKYEKGERDIPVSVMCKLAEYYNVSVGTLIGKNDYSRIIEYLNLCIDDLENNKNEYISNSKNYDYPKNTPYRVDSRVKNAFLDLLKGIKKNIESDTFSDKKLSNLSTVYVDLER